ncbi:hypothetical protein D3C71_2092020 [compost metagenome]
MKKAEDGDGLIVRLHEYKGGRGRVRFHFGMPVISWQETDMMERPLGESSSAAELELSMSPYEIKTIRLQLK